MRDLQRGPVEALTPGITRVRMSASPPLNLSSRPLGSLFLVLSFSPPLDVCFSSRKQENGQEQENAMLAW